MMNYPCLLFTIIICYLKNEIANNNSNEEEAGMKKYPCIPQLVIIASPSIITLITFYYIDFIKPLQDQIIIVYYYIFKIICQRRGGRELRLSKASPHLFSSLFFVHSEQNVKWMVRPFIQYCIELHTDGFFNFKKNVFTAVKRKASYK